jgi:HSP20 family protein
MNQIEKMMKNPWGEWMREFSIPELVIRPLYGSGLPEVIKVDVKDCKTEYVLEAEIPGVSKDDVKIEVDGDSVTISAEVRQCQEEKKDEKLVKSERYYGAVSRTVQLDSEVLSDSASAKYENGVLTVHLPKSERSNGKVVPVQ